MNFDFSPEQLELRSVLRRFLEEECPSSRVRVAANGDGVDISLWRELARLGYAGAAIDERHGGAGYGYLELCIVAEEFGRSLAPVPALSSIYLFAELMKEAGTSEQKARYLPQIASGELIGSLADTDITEGMTATEGRLKFSEGKVYGRKEIVLCGGIAGIAAVIAEDVDGTLSLFAVQLDTDTIARRNLKSLDPGQNYASLEFNGAPAERLGTTGEASAILAKVLNRAAVLVAFEQLGGADRAREMACGYAKERVAFGRPIGGFQAIKHMLADMYVLATLARSNAYYAAWALSRGTAELAVAAATARVSATDAFQVASMNNIQIHGGMGFTWAFDCHLYYRRSNTLALILGSQSTWERELVRRMLSDRAA